MWHNLVDRKIYDGTASKQTCKSYTTKACQCSCKQPTWLYIYVYICGSCKNSFSTLSWVNSHKQNKQGSVTRRYTLWRTRQKKVTTNNYFGQLEIKFRGERNSKVLPSKRKGDTRKCGQSRECADQLGRVGMPIATQTEHNTCQLKREGQVRVPLSTTSFLVGLLLSWTLVLQGSHLWGPLSPLFGIVIVQVLICSTLKGMASTSRKKRGRGKDW